MERKRISRETKKESTSSSRENLHPLQNEVILTNVFQHCSPTALKSCRLVCQMWRDVSLVQWRSSSTLKFCLERDAEDNIQIPIQPFLQFVREPKNECIEKPFRKFHLVGWKFSMEGSDNMFDMDWVEEFFDLVGSHVTSLESELCTFSGAKEFFRVVMGCCPTLKNLALDGIRFVEKFEKEEDDPMEPEYGDHTNLKSTSINLVTFSDDKFPMTFLKLFSHFPNLTSFRLEASDCDCCFGDTDPRTRVIGAIRTIKLADQQKLPIQDFYIRPFVKVSKNARSQETLNFIQELKIPLQSLAIELEPELDVGIVKDILKLHSSTLTKLVVTGTYRPSPPFPFGVQLDILQELEMSPGLCENMEFLRFMPLLRKIYNVTLWWERGREN